MAFTGYTIGPRGFAACVLADGRVLATGGADGDDATGTPSNGWDLFTVFSATNLSQESGSLLVARAAHGIAALASGDAVICGGWTTPLTMLATGERFDAVAETWSSIASMGTARMHHEMIQVGSSVLVIGGLNVTQALNRCELYDPIGDTWRYTGSMSYARVAFGVVKLPDGRVVVIGGVGYDPTKTATSAPLKVCEIYDPNTGLWTTLPPLRVARSAWPVVAYVAVNNSIMVAGGGDISIEVLNLSTMKWGFLASSLGTALTSSSGALASDDTLLVAGGLLVDSTEKQNYVTIPGSDIFWQGGMNRIATVESVPTPTSLTYKTTDYDYGKTYNLAAPGVTVTPMGAEPAPEGIPGPFTYDMKAGLPVTKTDAIIAQNLNKGHHYTILSLDDSVDPNPALAFPDEEGHLVFDFGFSTQVGPVKYLGRLSDTELMLDAGFKFPSTVRTGASVTLLFGRAPWQPPRGTIPGDFYATGSAAGHVAAQAAVEDTVAAGFDVDIEIVYPGDRGLGGEGLPAKGVDKLSDKVGVWGGDRLDEELPAARVDNSEET